MGRNKYVMLNAGNTISPQPSHMSNNSKEEFFNLYNNINNGKISVFNVDIDNLQKICQILEEECKLKETKLQNTKDNIEIHKRNIMYYKNITQN